MGGVPSGEALKTAESGLVQKAQQRIINFGNSWEDCIRMALGIQEAFGETIANPEDSIEIIWDDVETRNEQSHLETLRVKSELGVTKKQIWREMGYSQEQIEQMEEDNTAQQVADTNIGAEILRSFQGGDVE